MAIAGEKGESFTVTLPGPPGALFALPGLPRVPEATGPAPHGQKAGWAEGVPPCGGGWGDWTRSVPSVSGNSALGCALGGGCGPASHPGSPGLSYFGPRAAGAVTLATRGDVGQASGPEPEHSLAAEEAGLQPGAGRTPKLLRKGDVPGGPRVPESLLRSLWATGGRLGSPVPGAPRVWALRPRSGLVGLPLLAGRLSTRVLWAARPSQFLADAPPHGCL